MKQLFIALFIMMTTMTNLSFAQSGKNWNLFVGTYTRGKSEGIYVYEFNSKTGKLIYKSVTKGITNPSFLALSPDRKNLFAIHEIGKGAISSYKINAATGGLILQNTVGTAGANSCYVAVDRNGKHVASGNYSGGNLSVHAVNEDGSLTEAVQVIQHAGKGPDVKRQTTPHVHATDFTPDGRFLLVCDLGIDKIVAYPYNTAEKVPLKADAAIDYIAKPGSGPRHIAFHPNNKLIYLLDEMGGDVTVLQYKDGKLTALSVTSILPENFNGIFGASEVKISPDGKFLYASNRLGLNEIVVFSIDKKEGSLKYVSRIDSGGKTPRHFEIDPTGNFLLAGNQDSDNITVFKRNKRTGALTDTGIKVEVGAPTCLVFAPLK